jgi:hypothetical protein
VPDHDPRAAYPGPLNSPPKEIQRLVAAARIVTEEGVERLEEMDRMDCHVRRIGPFADLAQKRRSVFARRLEHQLDVVKAECCRALRHVLGWNMRIKGAARNADSQTHWVPASIAIRAPVPGPRGKFDPPGTIIWMILINQ